MNEQERQMLIEISENNGIVRNDGAMLERSLIQNGYIDEKYLGGTSFEYTLTERGIATIKEFQYLLKPEYKNLVGNEENDYGIL